MCVSGYGRLRISKCGKKRAVNMCVCEVCEVIRLRLNNIFTVLGRYGWLLDTYIVDFFQDNVWINLPQNWRDALGEASTQELSNWATAKNSRRVWPLSMLALQKTIQSLAINRNHENKKILKCCGSRTILENDRTELVGSSSNIQKNHLSQEHEKLFRKSVKMKKRHEIEKIAETTSQCAQLVNCKCIVDIGAGIGHLARTLAYNYGLCVVCLEQDELLSRQARVHDEKLFRQLQKTIPDVLRSPRHVSIKMVESDVQDDLMEQLESEFVENFQLDEARRGFGLVGLHTCGDLAANLLRLYSQQDRARFICIVGCCYMKITCGIKQTASFGYPMSTYVSEIENHKFSYAALEVACHAIENYCDKLRTGHYQDLLVHAYRATLEKILIEKNGKSMRRSHLRNVRLKENMTFERYCTIATKDLELENQPNADDLKTEEVAKCLARWREVVAFGTLRFMLATLVETAVLFDRFLYLSENNLAPSLEPIFDATLSPRNIVLTSYKYSTET